MLLEFLAGMSLVAYTIKTLSNVKSAKTVGGVVKKAVSVAIEAAMDAGKIVSKLRELRNVSIKDFTDTVFDKASQEEKSQIMKIFAKYAKGDDNDESGMA